MLSPLLSKAAGYVLAILAKNEEVQKFPKEFIDESVKWVKSWFLKPEEPTSTAILENPAKSESLKRELVETQLQSLESNPEFMAQLTAMLEKYDSHKPGVNQIEESEIEADNFHQGTTGGEGGDNIIKKTTIKLTGDFRQGNDFNKP